MIHQFDDSDCHGAQGDPATAGVVMKQQSVSSLLLAAFDAALSIDAELTLHAHRIRIDVVPLLHIWVSVHDELTLSDSTLGDDLRLVQVKHGYFPIVSLLVSP